MTITSEHGIYQIGLKALLQKDDLVLLLRDKATGRLDLPGGRISSSESDVPLIEILAREVREELGDKVTYTVGGPLGQFRRYNKQVNMPVFITVYSAQYISGDITLSDELSSYEWVNLKDTGFTEIDFGNSEENLAMEKVFTTLAGVK